MSGHFDFLHVKKNSAGSPNELSFDVLDAARSQLDGKKSRTSRGSLSTSPKQGSYHGVGSGSTLSAVPEVERRKKLLRALGAGLAPHRQRLEDRHHVVPHRQPAEDAGLLS